MQKREKNRFADLTPFKIAESDPVPDWAEDGGLLTFYDGILSCDDVALLQSIKSCSLDTVLVENGHSCLKFQRKTTTFLYISVMGF